MRYRCDITFNEGAASREVMNEVAMAEYDVFQMALVDMRMSSGPGLIGKVKCWTVITISDEVPNRGKPWER